MSFVKILICSLLHITMTSLQLQIGSILLILFFLNDYFSVNYKEQSNS